MKSIRRPLISLILLFVSLSLLPGIAMGQCVVTNTSINMPYGSGTTFVTKTLSAAAQCNVTGTGAGFGAAQCHPATTPLTTNVLQAVRSGSSLNPFCNWECTCGTGAGPHVTTNGANDGLPVELLEFQIDDSDFATPGKD